ncbi:MAG: hypothetical protein H6698_05745 [Myxococcales bacterium]|nr:hypothetical protein [Myxococcales bacterium]MCB9532581.1 hypothetical protein [Myxococcales bacterium]MCB9533807.1 hypothetical protein [Myxococcales bacterium]
MVVPAALAAPPLPALVEPSDAPAEVVAQLLVAAADSRGMRASAGETSADGRVARAHLESVSAHYLVLVGPVEPTAADVDALVAEAYGIPGRLDTDGRPWRVSVIRPTPAPFPVAYVTSNEWWSLLEASLYSELAGLGANGGLASDYADVAEATLRRFGIDTEGPREDAAARLDALVAALPRPTAEGELSFAPVATLLAVGLAVGELVRADHARFAWVDADTALARYFGLEAGGAAGPLRLRPIDFVFELYRVPREAGIADYLTLVDERAGSPAPLDRRDRRR